MQLKERPSALLDAAPRARRDTSYALLEDLDYRDRRRSIGVGIVLTIIIWLACFFLFDLLITRISEQHAAGTAGAATRPKPKFDIQLQDDSYLMPQKPPPTPPPQRFVETNPDAPENIPDKTNNFAAQNQQAAQEKPDPTGKSDRAATEGKKDWETNQIVSGQLRQPQIQLPPPPPPTPEIQETKTEQPAPAQREQIPLTGDQKIQGPSETGIGMNDIKLPDATTAKPNPDIDQLIKGLRDATDDTGIPRITTPQIDPRHPQPRRTLAKNNVRPAVLAENKVGTPNIGITGQDARWSNYGTYLQKLVDTVQIQWEDLNEKSKVWPPNGTKITVKFRIDSEGKITEIVDTDSNGGTQATNICKSAITDRAPYGKWTDDMIALLGDSQELTFTFYYGMP